MYHGTQSHNVPWNMFLGTLCTYIVFVSDLKMPRSKSGIKRTPVDSNNMMKAIKAVTAIDDTKISIREACKVYNVKLATLSRAIAKFKESDQSNFKYITNFDVKKVFNEQEESMLEDYIKTVANMKYGLSKKGVRLLAYKFAVANNKKIPDNWEAEKIAGEQWMRHFLKRHGNTLSIRKPEATSLSRSTSFNKNNVDKFFNNLIDVHNRFGPIPGHRIWNLDETGLTTVQTPGPIVAPKGVKQVGGCTSAERGSLITMNVAINAIGNHIPPLLIFPRVYFKDRMLFGAPPGTIGGATPTGWSNEEMFLKFLNHFLNHVKSSKEERVMLLLDNHESHLSIEVLDLASDNGIVMVTFPPHCSNRLQPLDLTVFGPLKTYYNQAVDDWHLNHPGKTFDIYSVAEVVGKVFPKAFSTKNIENGFKAAGIFPLDQNVFTDDDFLCSAVTDRRPTVQENGTSVSNNENEEVDRSIPISCLQPSTSAKNLPLNDDLVAISRDDINIGLPILAEINKSPLLSDMPTEPPRVGYDNTKIVSPEEIQPYPKAPPRKTSKRGRKPGRTLIPTDTPEKEQIRIEKGKKVKKQRVEEKKTCRKINFDKDVDLSGRKRKQIRKKMLRTQNNSSSSSDDDIVPLVDTDNEDSADEECLFCYQPYKLDLTGEQWIRCITCKRWAHELCAGTDKKGWKTYICDFCIH